MMKKHVLLGSASAIAVSLLTMPVVAQDQLETVVVTGIRASLQSAQAIKQNSDQVVDSITATDIGALPDRNVAEALQRVPGVTLQRNDAANDLVRMGSTGNSVYVRGLSWVKTLVNGRDEFTAVNGRSLSFADVSADLMSGVDVYKSPDAKMIEGGVGGTIDLKTRKPFDMDGQKIAFSGDVTYGDLVDRALPSFNGLYSNRWSTGIGELGVLASVDWQDQITRTEGINLGNFDCWDTAAGTYAASSDTAYDSCMGNDLGTERVMGPQGWAWRQMEFKQQRLASNLVLQWRPNDQWEFTLSGLNTYAHITDVEHYVYMTISATQMASAKFDSDYNWVGGDSSLSSMNVRAGTGHNRNTDVSLNVKYNPSDALEISADFQFVESSSPRKDVTMYTGMVTKPTVSVDVSGNNPKIAVEDLSTNSSLGNYYWSAAMDHLQYNVAHAGNARLDATYTFQQEGGLFGLIKNVQAGFRTEQKLAVSRSTGYNWGSLSLTWNGTYPLLDGTIAGCSTGTTCSFAAADGNTYTSATGNLAKVNSYAQLYSYNSVFGNKLPSFWLPSVKLASMNTATSSTLLQAVEGAGVVDAYGEQNWAQWISYATEGGCSGDDTTCLNAYQNESGSNSSGNRTNTQNEKTYAGYFEVNYAHDTLFGYDVPVDGNIGFRIVRTEDQVSSGLLVMPYLQENSCTVGAVVDGATVTSCDNWNTAVAFLGGTEGAGATVARPGVSHGYTSVLPSFNFRAKLSETVQARLAYSESIVRPDFSYTNSSATLQFNWYDANTYRAGVFKTDPSGYGGNPYLKPMHATNYDASLEWYFNASGSLTLSLFHKDLSNYIFTATTKTAFVHPTSGQAMDFNYTTYVNGDKGKVEGFEIGYQQFFDQLPGFWSGFGVQANYTKIYNSGGHNGAASLSSTVAINNASNKDLPLEGMSNDSYNLALMYGKYDIDARLAWNWRSEYLSSSANSTSPNEPVWLENYGQLDGSVFYTFLEHYKVGLQVTNITGSVFYTDMGYADYHPRVNWIESDRKFAFVWRANW